MEKCVAHNPIFIKLKNIKQKTKEWLTKNSGYHYVGDMKLRE